VKRSMPSVLSAAIARRVFYDPPSGRSQWRLAGAVGAGVGGVRRRFHPVPLPGGARGEVGSRSSLVVSLEQFLAFG